MKNSRDVLDEVFQLLQEDGKFPNTHAQGDENCSWMKMKLDGYWYRFTIEKVFVDDERNILEFSIDDTGHCFLEGNSPVVMAAEGGSGWFEFETDSRGEAVKHLQKLGFTAHEIEEAGHK